MAVSLGSEELAMPITGRAFRYALAILAAVAALFLRDLLTLLLGVAFSLNASERLIPVV
jgi:hypothetical protein